MAKGKDRDKVKDREKDEDRDLEQAQEDSAREAPLQVLVRLLRETLPKRRKLYLLSLLSIVGVAIFTSGLAYSTRLIVNNVFAGDFQQALWVAGMVVAVSAGKSVAEYANAIVAAMFTRSVTSYYQRRLFSTVLRRDVGFFAGKQAAAHMSKVNSLGSSAARVVVSVSIRMMTQAVTLVGLVVVMVVQDPVMSLFTLALFPIIFLFVARLSRRIREVARAETELTGAYFAVGSEAFAGIRTVRSYGLEEKSTRKFDSALQKLEMRSLGIVRVTSLTVPLMQLLGGIVLALFVLYASWQTGSAGRTPGDFTAFITAFLLAYQPAERLSRDWVDVQKSLANAGKMFHLLDDTPEYLADGPRLHLDGAGAGIEFRDLSFTYDGNDPALHQVSFTIQPGEKVAIVGRSGAGKSTLIDLVQGFVRATEGQVLIGGQDIAPIPEQALRDHIALTSQDVFLFEGSIRDNIRDGKPGATEAEIEAAARAAQVTVFTEHMAAGLDAQVGPNGALLSGGQKQRVGIARALVKDARICIFDEATSALDSQTERGLLRSIAGPGGAGRTMLFVTHRPATLQYVDRVLVLDHGRLIAFDTHERLVAENETYRTLFSIGFEDEETTGAPPAEEEPAT